MKSLFIVLLLTLCAAVFVSAVPLDYDMSNDSNTNMSSVSNMSNVSSVSNDTSACPSMSNDTSVCGSSNATATPTSSNATMTTVVPGPVAPTATCKLVTSKTFNISKQVQAFFPAYVLLANGTAQPLLVPAPQDNQTQVVPADNNGNASSILSSAVGQSDNGTQLIQGFFPATVTNDNGTVTNVTGTSSDGTMEPAVGLDGNPIFVTGPNGTIVQIFVPAANSSIAPAEVSGTNGSKPEFDSTVVPAECVIQSNNTQTNITQTNSTQTSSSQETAKKHKKSSKILKLKHGH